MKRVLILAFIFCNHAFSYYEDHPVVSRLASSGKPNIIFKSDKCTGNYSSTKELTHQLGNGAGYRGHFCVKLKALPKNVLNEIIFMKANELENESDYDQRITAYYQFKQNTFSLKNISINNVKKMADALGIDSEFQKNFSFGVQVVNESSFAEFEYLVNNDSFNGHPSKTLKHLRKSLKGKLAQIVTFGDGIELYPGGGLLVTFYLIFIDGEMTFIKLSGWDS